MKKAAIGLTILVLLGLIVYPIEVSAQISAPSPFYEYTPLTPRVGDIVTFDASDFGAYWKESTIVSLDWNFGDGTTQTGTVINHIFSQVGEYLVELTATDNRGMTASSAHLVTVREQTPITVYVSLLSDRVYIGQEVVISGNLTYEGKGVADATVSFSTKVYLDDAPWVDIGNTSTNNDGTYTFVWEPKRASGYQLQALWSGNSTYPEKTSLSRNIYVLSYGDFITDFSSNSTVTGMNYNMTTTLLTFTAEGPSGTTGYVNVTLEKDPAFNPQNVIVQLDNQPIQYTVESTSQSWTLFFTYTHSSHNIVVDFTGSALGQETSNTPWPPDDRNAPSVPLTPTIATISAVLVAVVIIGLVVYFKKHRH